MTTGRARVPKHVGRVRPAEFVADPLAPPVPTAAMAAPAVPPPIFVDDTGRRRRRLRRILLLLAVVTILVAAVAWSALAATPAKPAPVRTCGPHAAGCR